MSLNLEFNPEKLYEERFCTQLAGLFPEEFSAIPVIKTLKDKGYELVSVTDDGGDVYGPSELRKLLTKDLLPWGVSKRMSELTFDREYSFVFKKNGNGYSFPANTRLILADKKLGMAIHIGWEVDVLDGSKDPEEYLHETQE